MRIVVALAFGIALLSPVLLFAVPKHEAAPAKLCVIPYAVADLPVWRTNLKDAPKFAPELLVTYLQSTVDPASWEAGAQMRPFERNASLVISQTQANHEKIADELRAFREVEPREVEEKVVR